MLLTGTFPRAPLLALLSGEYSRADANAVGLYCHALARAAVNRRAGRLRLHRGAGVLTGQDIIQECFVQLFRRDGGGRFTELCRFFQRYCPDPATASDAALLSTLRHLVTAKVSNGVVSALCKSDPSLCRLLRNLRLAVKSTRLFESIHRLGEEHLRPIGVPPRLHLVCIPLEILQERLMPAARERDGAPTMLRNLHAVLAGAEEYQPAVPFVPLGILLRRVYAGDGAGPVATDSEPSDTQRLLPEILCRFRAPWERSYVASGKLTPEEFNAVLASLETVIPDPTGERGSYFDCLQEHLPGLTREEYARKFRTVMEYLARTGRRELASMLRR